ncbi:ABC transporter ATP-binding protein/permease [Opitutia bacterium ISCC 51]|nr:ABC transporter ATP-binding protein/permease [Opitutae bacterium ISCC 51]QXD26884.1 ABC transporter ATP-binding protein/permease [Opitutae bacterium ISCC 52]
MDKFFAFRRYLRSCKGRFLLGIAAGLIMGVSSGFGVPYYIQVVFANVFESASETYSGFEIFFIAAQLPGVFLIRGISGYFNQLWMNHCGLTILKGIRADLFAKIQHLPLAYHDRTKSGDLLSRILSDTTLLQHTLQETANGIFAYPLQVIGAFSYLVFLSIQQKEVVFILFIILTAPLAVVPVLLIGRRLKKHGIDMQESQGEMTEGLSENLDSATEVRTFNLQDQQISIFDRFLQKLFRKQMKVVKYERMAQPLIEFLASALVSVTFIFCYLNEVKLSTFLALGGVMFMTYDPLKRVFRLYGNIQKCQGAINRINESLEEPDSMQDPDRPVQCDIPEGRITFEDVSFGYADVPVIKHLSATIEPGSVVALVGPSGAGKSTFAKLIPRLYEITNGSIQIDGTDIRHFTKKHLRDKIAVVSQHPVLFDDSLFNNILIGRPDATREEVIQAARDAHAHEFIDAFEKGYDTMAGERGGQLSGGQIQRIAIARAFLRNSPILILDEATSALDSHSEEEIQKALASLVVGKTVIIIAHRFSTIRLADDIMVFENGELVASGSHETLYQTDPLYTALYTKQL